MYFLKILLSLSGAVMLATLPGFFDISYGVGGLTIRAAGGAAAFVFIYTQSPNVPNFAKPTTAPHVTTRPAATASAQRFDADSTPLLVALSIDPSGIASQSASASTDAGSAQTGDGATASGQGGNVGQAAAVLTLAISTVRDGAARLAAMGLELLDRIAIALRSGVSWVGDRISGLIGQLRSLQGMPAADIQAVLAAVPDTAANLANAAVAPAVTAIDQLSVKLADDIPVLASVGDAVADVPVIVTSAVGNTAGTVGNLVGGVLHSPKDAVALTGKAVGELTGDLADTTRDVLATTKKLTQGINAQASAVTETLNGVAPEIVAQVSPVFGKLHDVTGKGHDTASDLVSALPPLTAALENTDGLKLPPLTGSSGRLAESKVEEIRGGCATCVLQPLDLGGRLLDAGFGRRGLGAAGAVSGSGGVAGGSALGGGSSGGDGPAGSGPAGGGPVSSTVRGVGSAVGNTTRGLLGRR